MRILLLTLAIGVLGISSYAQTLRTFKYLGYSLNGHYYLGVALSHGEVRNKGAVRPDRHNISGNFAEINVKRHNFEPRGFRYDLDTKMYADILKGLGATLLGRENIYNRGEVTSLTSGPLGWHTLAWNTFTGSTYNVALGFNHNDYFYFMEDRDIADKDKETAAIVVQDPQGYYFSSGPSLIADYLVNDYLLVNFKTSYSIGYWKAVDLSSGVSTPGYPLPHFYGASLELLSPWGVFVEIDHNRIINRGPNPNKGNRTDFNLGFKFVIGQDN